MTVLHAIANVEEIPAKMRQKMMENDQVNPFDKPFQKYICVYFLMDSTGK